MTCVVSFALQWDSRLAVLFEQVRNSDGRGAFLRDELRESAFPRVLSSRWHMARRFLQVQAPGVIPFILGAIIMLLGVVAPLGYMVYKNRKVFQRQTDRKL